MSNSSKLYYKTCREQSGLTQEQAIVLLGITEVATLSRYENGHVSVTQEMAAAMVRVYRTPLLAYWYVCHSNPDLAQYLPVVTQLVTDGDAMLQMELSDDDISEARAAVKAVLRDGTVTPEETEHLKSKAKNLRVVAAKILSAATYLEKREASNPDGGDA